MMRLSELPMGATATIVKILGHGAFSKRVIEMGFVRGSEIKVLLQAPLNDPIKYSIKGYEVSLRRKEAQMIIVDDVRESAEEHPAAAEAVGATPEVAPCDCGTVPSTTSGRHTINVALLGNPNCGKTSLFNVASGAHEHVGNYSGVTVDAKEGTFDYRGYRFNIVDLPGTYSLTSYSPEEQYVRRYLKEETPDVMVNVVDSSNLERNLYLTTELIDMNRSMVIALNMYDELRNHGAHLEYETLGNMIGVPMVPVVSKTGEGVDELFDTIIEVYERQSKAVRHVHVPLGQDIEKMLRVLIDELKAEGDTSLHVSPRYLAIKLIEGDPMIEQELAESAPKGEVHRIVELRNRLMEKYNQTHTQEDVNATIAAEKYGFISGALAETYRPSARAEVSKTQIIDAFVTNKLFGFPLFFLIMFVIFWATFSIGQYPMDWIDMGVAWLSDTLSTALPDGILKDMIVDGIIGGVGGVIVFLPNILILYFCISFMEGSGYMARAAFIMDKVMHKIGLHGKSFIPLVMGFGCNVPAIMASRAIESRSSRIITILINPFMSCSARLPIYVLLIGTFFPSHPSLVFMGLYVSGIIVAVITAKLLRRFFFKADETPFVMELPPYRIPTLRASLRQTWGKGQQYLRKMGGVILVASIIVWALNYFPQGTNDDGSKRDSYLEMAGKAIDPVMQPIGMHWRASVAALAGVPAKEIVVSTLGVLYTDDEAASDQKLGQKMRSTGDWDAPAALAFMIFILLYCPCIATVTAVVRETGTWRYGAFSVVYNTLVAWVVALLVYHAALLFT